MEQPPTPQQWNGRLFSFLLYIDILAPNGSFLPEIKDVEGMGNAV